MPRLSVDERGLFFFTKILRGPSKITNAFPNDNLNEQADLTLHI
jgi:hypothetical protein